MKYRILILLLTAAAIIITLVVVSQKRSYERAVYHGRHVSEWALDLASTSDPVTTNEAIQAIQALGSNGVPALRALLNSRTPLYEKLFLQNARRLPRTSRRYLFDKVKPGQSISQRLCAVRALNVLGPTAGAAAPDLIGTFNDPVGEIRWAAAQTLGRMGAPAISALAAAATNANDTLRHTAVYALGEAGTNAAAVASLLFAGILDPNESVRATAIYSLSRIGPAGVGAALQALSAEAPARRTAAIQALQAMNRPPRQVSRTLLEFATNSSPRVRRDSLAGLQALRLNSPNVLAAYVRALNDPDANVRRTATLAVSQAVIGATNAVFNEAAVRTLGLSGSLGSNVVVKLNGLLMDAEPSVRTAAQRALTEIQSAPPN